MRIRLVLLFAVTAFAAHPARSQSAFPQGSVSSDQAIGSFGQDEDTKSGSDQGFDTPDSDSAGPTNYAPPDTPYTSSTYENSGEVCVTCSDDSGNSTSDNSDSNSDNSSDSSNDDE